MYVFGGTVRRALFNDTRFGDLDLMIPNGDARAFEVLGAELRARNKKAAFSLAPADSNMFLELCASPDSSRTVGQATISVEMKKSRAISLMTCSC